MAKQRSVLILFSGSEAIAVADSLDTLGKAFSYRVDKAMIDGENVEADLGQITVERVMYFEQEG